MKIKLISALLLTALLSVFLFTESVKKPAERSAPDNLQAEADTTAPQETTTAAETDTTTSTTATETTTTTAATEPPEPPADLVLRGLDTVEAGADLTLADFITERNVELRDGSVMLDTSEIGSFEADVPYLYEGTEFTQTISYRVADTTKPIVINPGNNSAHKINTAFDLSNYVGFADNFDAHPVLTYEGEVDPDTPGSYPLTATVTDSSGNAVSWELTINVIESSPQGSGDTIPRVDYSDFISRYSGDNVRFGIDVSAWQGEIDFDAVRDAGCSFVMIRVGYYYSQVKPDDYFRQNLKNAADAGLDVGIYFYTTDRTEEGVREHVRWIAEQLGGQKLDLPIAFDWEEFSHFQEYGMSIRDLNNVYAAFADEVIKQGYKPMLYSSKYFLNIIWSERSKRSAPVWLAHYVRQTDYEGDYAIWQESAYGRIPGISGDVDMDIQYLDKQIG
ncbi:MAG: glycoside hydrolase family 25 [Oscillospiraceae bacterium]|nr:glycoside hydrolase family 25 [Oscillospiraceae bacterium]